MAAGIGGAGRTKSAGKGRPGRRKASAEWRLPNPRPEIDWQLGVPGHLHGDVLTVRIVPKVNMHGQECQV